MRHTRAHTGNRRSHHAVTSPTTSACSNCKAPKLPHRACGSCGKYNNRVVVDTVAKIAKKEARKKAASKKS